MMSDLGQFSLSFKPAHHSQTPSKSAPTNQQGSKVLSNQALSLLHRSWKDPNLQPKLKTFLWKLLRYALATAERVSRFSQHKEDRCVACNQVEDDLHLFFNCSLPRATWFSTTPSVRTDQAATNDQETDDTMQVTDSQLSKCVAAEAARKHEEGGGGACVRALPTKLRTASPPSSLPLGGPLHSRSGGISGERRPDLGPSSMDPPLLAPDLGVRLRATSGGATAVSGFGYGPWGRWEKHRLQLQQAGGAGGAPAMLVPLGMLCAALPKAALPGGRARGRVPATWGLCSIGTSALAGLATGAAPPTPAPVVGLGTPEPGFFAKSSSVMSSMHSSSWYDELSLQRLLGGGAATVSGSAISAGLAAAHGCAALCRHC
ncbi:hypothetical protein U9M48_021903 [Paspalum notatum var. saurae]|uniref:Reverse transcriptase zinc-binding domain-containing protein n=1 Tax=Paspalum notatum var. saurae TaxID=547442 RepID=A0AAQ3WTG7_PASNO